MSNWDREAETGGVTAGSEESDLDVLFNSLASAVRRRVLRILYERAPTPLTRRDLATYLTPEYREQPRERDATEAMRHVFRDLHHVHLPKLDAAGLIDRDTTRGTVTISNHPAFSDSGIVSAITGEEDTDPESFDTLFAALADSHRRTILDVLSHRLDPIRLETLARELGTRFRDVAESNVPQETVEQTLTDLHHVHLPHLSEAGLIDYEADERTVAYAGHPALRVRWTHSVLEPEFRSSLTGESEPKGIGEIEGRERVVSFGQSLCERADEELFCMFTDTDLLEAGCITRIRNASRRGVDVYLGTCDPTVREYVEENAPAVVLWEPSSDWLNLPAAGGRVGRLLLADREAVMLGTIREETTNGSPQERAIVGEGAHNTLVTALCQLLTPHLERIDDRTDDIASRLPL